MSQKPSSQGKTSAKKAQSAKKRRVSFNGSGLSDVTLGSAEDAVEDEADDFLSVMMKGSGSAGKAVKKAKKTANTEETEDDAASAAAWFERMSHGMSNLTEIIDNNNDFDEDDIDAEKVAAKYLSSAPLLSERKDIFNAAKEKKLMALAQQKKQKNKNTAEGRLEKKLASLEARKDKSEEGGGDSFLQGLLKVRGSSALESDDELEELEQLLEDRAFQTPEQRYVADASVIGTSHDFDDYKTVDCSLSSGSQLKVVASEKSASRAKISHRMLACATQEDKISAIREVLDTIEEQESASRVKTVTLVFVKDSKHAKVLHPRIGRQYCHRLKTNKGNSNAGVEVRTKWVEMLYDGLKDDDYERVFHRVRSGRCRTLILDDVSATKVWPLRHMVGQIIHFDLPINSTEYRERTGMAARKVNVFPTNQLQDAEGNAVPPEALKNPSLLLLLKTKQAVEFCKDVVTLIKESGQVKVVEAMHKFIEEGSVKQRKYI